MSLVRFIGSALGCLYRERRFDRTRMQRTQSERLARLLQYAKATTPLWADRITDARPDRLADIPPITKAELMANFDASIAHGAVTLSRARAFSDDAAAVGRMLDDRYVIATTSGTTGRVGTFVTDRQAWSALNGALLARILRHRLVPHEIIRFCWGRRYRMSMTVATSGHFITNLVSTYRPVLARAIMTMHAYSIMSPIDDTVRALNRYRPHYIHGYPSFVEVLAATQLVGELKIDPEFISLGSEQVSQLARQTITRAFPNAEVSETYGATECLTIANQCRYGTLHVNDDLCVLEPVDADGRPVPPGVSSEKVFVTNLLNHAQPLIRYELNDSVTMLDGACECGTSLPIIRVEGRSDDTFHLQDGDGRYRPFPPLPFEVLFLNVDGLRQYQLIHETQNHLRVRFVCEPAADVGAIGRTLETRFKTYLRENHIGEAASIRIEPVDDLEREAHGHKLRQIYSKVARPHV